MKTGSTDGPNVIRNIDITLGGTESVDNDFGEAKLATISGHVYHDEDNDGNRDAGEDPISGVMIRIIPVDTVTPQQEVIVYTDANGYTTRRLLLAGTGHSNRADQLLLRDHLLSVDMLRKLDQALKLRAHYSDSARDPVSRLWSSDGSIEHFHQYYLSRVSVEYDDYSGVLVVEAQAYDPRTARAITAALAPSSVSRSSSSMRR